VIRPWLLVFAGALVAGQDPSRPLPPLSQVARDATREGLAFVELATERPTAFVGERVLVELRFGLDREVQRASLVQPFQVRLDLPVQLAAPWTEELARARTLGVVDPPPPAGVEARPTFALNGAVQRARARADRDVDGHPFAVYAVEVALVPTAAGELALSAPALRLARATRFEESLFEGRRPLDREDLLVVGEPLVLRVDALPEAGRPPAFSGAVGRFSVSARAAESEVRVGETLKLELRITGDGDLSGFRAPAWEELGAFRVVGVLDAREPDARLLTLDLAPHDERAWQVPPVPFAYFDPVPPAGYRTARSEPVEVAVGPARSAGPAPTAAATESAEPPAQGRGALSGVVLVLAGAALLLVLVLVLVLAARRPAR
jgi:hypothetical protein